MDDRRRHLAIAVGGSALLVIGAVIVIFLIGVRHVPDYPTVAEQPEPVVDGRLAYLTWEAPHGPCLYVQDIGAEPRAISCGEDSIVEPDVAQQFVTPEWFGWDDEGHLLVAEYSRDDVVLVTLDVDTGAELGREQLPVETERPDTRVRADGAQVGTTWSEDGTAEVWVREPGGTTQTLLRARGPDGYSFWNAQWSPHGDFVLVQDSEGRTLVVAADGDPAPRVLLRGADSVAWYQPS